MNRTRMHKRLSKQRFRSRLLGTNHSSKIVHVTDERKRFYSI